MSIDSISSADLSLRFQVTARGKLDLNSRRWDESLGTLPFHSLSGVANMPNILRVRAVELSPHPAHHCRDSLHSCQVAAWCGDHFTDAFDAEHTGELYRW